MPPLTNSGVTKQVTMLAKVWRQTIGLNQSWFSIQAATVQGINMRNIVLFLKNVITVMTSTL